MIKKEVKKISQKNRKGLSPVIATVLLIGIVIMIGVIIFLWFKNMQQETITKFGDTNIELICDEIDFDTSYSEGNLYISNKGNVPIYNINIKMISDGSYETDSLREMSDDWPNEGLNQGATFSGIINLESGVTKIKLIPILLGSSTKGEKIFICDENQGYEIEF